MRKVKLMMMTLIMSLIFISCQKDKNCNCGIITNDNIEISNSELFYTLTIKNDCSGNQEKFYFDYNTWLNAPVGQHFCISNVSSWMPLSDAEIIIVENKEII
jgi:hypothetical protein